MIRSKSSNLGSIPVALLPVSPKDHLKEHRQATVVKAQPVHNQEVLKKVFRLIFRHLDALFHTRQRILCADGQTQECYPVLSASTANYFESIHLHSVNHPNCLGREAPKSLFGEGNTL